MKIIKKINTSAAIALDSAGREVVVLGKGIGFPATPYDLNNLDKIDRTFYDVDPKYLGIIADLPTDLLLNCADIAEQAELDLGVSLNPNLGFTLADHLFFSMQNAKNRINLITPIAYDIIHLYPKEYDFSVKSLKEIERKTGNVLPEYEAINIALHLINAETENGEIQNAFVSMKIIEKINSIIEENLKIHINKDSYNYNRFAMHLRYLIQRLQSKQDLGGNIAEIQKTLVMQYPYVYECTQLIIEYLRDNYQWECNNNEIVYLMIHIQRLQERNQN